MVSKAYILCNYPHYIHEYFHYFVRTTLETKTKQLHFQTFKLGGAVL